MEENSVDQACAQLTTVENLQNSDCPVLNCKRKSEENDIGGNKKIGIQNYSLPSASTPLKQSSHNEKTIDSEELNNILDGMMDYEIDDALEKSAAKNNLTRTNVKNILKYVITNEYVLSMVRNTMKLEKGEGELEEAVFEPKLTRSKAKELNINQCTGHWPAPTPVKKIDQVAVQLLGQEFPDESSDDEDYKPNEEEELSDDDTTKSPRTSELWSPPVAPSPPQEVQKVLESYADDEEALVIELPDFSSISENEADKIALRTRSKLCLNDTPLEEIEASFYAPDFTVDMYDTGDMYEYDDDWLIFLNNLSKPIDVDKNTTQVREEDPDDTEDDPEYSFHEDEDAPDAFDLTFNQTTRNNAKNELNALMAEILEFAEQDYGDDEEEDHPPDEVPVEPLKSLFTSTEGGVESRSEWMNSDEKLQLDEQMRMYVQLLTQVYLLSHGTPDLNNINLTAQLFLNEINMFANRQESTKSAFNAHNLDEALRIINKFEKYNTAHQIKRETPYKYSPVPLFAKRTMATSKVFIYPDLLPVMGFPQCVAMLKSYFPQAEDYLIAIGLEQFASCKSRVELIQELLVPTKTVKQLKNHIKHCSKPIIPIDNPIKHYLTHKEAPPFTRVVEGFDPVKVVIPARHPAEIMPRWMKYYCAVASGDPMFVPRNLTPCQEVKPTQPSPIKPQVAVVRPTFRKMPRRRKSQIILPYGTNFSPHKLITPILKKYSQPKKTITALPYSGPYKDKDKRPGRTIRAPYPRYEPNCSPRAIQPKPTVSTSQSQPVVIVPVNDNYLQCTSTQQVQLFVKTEPSSCSPPPKMCGIANPIISLLPACPMKPEENSAAVIPMQRASVTAIPMIPVISDHLEGCDKDDKSPVKGTIPESDSHTAKDPVIGGDERDSKLTAVSLKKKTISEKSHSHKDLESSLTLLKPTMVNTDPKQDEKENLYVNSYLLRVSESLKKDPEVWKLFLKSLCKYQDCFQFPIKLYLDLKVVLRNYPALLDDFVVFLKPSEAKQVGKYEQYLKLNKVREFLRKVEIHFNNQPQHITKIVRALSQFKQQSYVTSTEALNGLLPLLKNQTHLMEELLQLLPDAAL